MSRKRKKENVMRYIESDRTDPYFNLALEEYVFEKLPREESYFMLWQNENTIVIGKYQNAMEEINPEYVDEQGIRVVRRLSGGGAVYHDSGNLNFTFITDQGKLNQINFQVFVQPVLQTLQSFGIQAEFTGRNDIVIDGCKISGNSQYLKEGRVMHHGCIMLDSDLERVSKALRVREAKFQSKNVKSVRSRVTTINAHASQRITMEAFKAALKQNILGDSDVRPYELKEEDLEAIERLRVQKYATWEWNYGKMRPFEVVREEKFAAGLLKVHLNVAKGRIREIAITGDFFGNGEISELEEALAGLPLDEQLSKRLSEMNLSYYISGISPEELSRLIRG